VSQRLKLVILFLIFLHLIFASWYALHQDITFSSDIARDFLLFSEIDTKKVVLIGPRSSTGLFHGPLWLYLNYPAYVIGNGNPVIVGWYWIVLTAVFLVTSFFIAKKLFNETTAYLYLLFLSLYMGFHTKGFYNPHGAMLLLPAFFYFFIQYITTYKLRHLLLHLVIAACIIQFQMAIGIPFTLLSLTAIAFCIVRVKKYKHLFVLPLIAISIVNFIFFDLRHDFLMAKQLFGFVSPQANGQVFNYATLVLDRLHALFFRSELLRANYGLRGFFALLPVMLFLYWQIKQDTYKQIYQYFLYFYCGFFLLSFINKGPMLYFYLFPLFPLLFLIFASFITSKYNRLFIVIFAIFYLFNVITALNDIRDAQTRYIGKQMHSWKGFSTMIDTIYKDSEQFGYFVYSPDAVAYEPHYAMAYGNKKYGNKATRSEKKETTYVVIAPPPVDDPYVSEKWWINSKANIKKEPTRVFSFSNAYKVNKYLLTSEEVKTPAAADIDLGLHFR
jgi:ABC-type multidrug transport system fused ATPase/permease subunit